MDFRQQAKVCNAKKKAGAVRTREDGTLHPVDQFLRPCRMSRARANQIPGNQKRRAVCNATRAAFFDDDRCNSVLLNALVLLYRSLADVCTSRRPRRSIFDLFQQWPCFKLFAAPVWGSASLTARGTRAWIEGASRSVQIRMQEAKGCDWKWGGFREPEVANILKQCVLRRASAAERVCWSLDVLCQGLKWAPRAAGEETLYRAAVERWNRRDLLRQLR